MSTRKAQLLKRIAGKKGRSTALTEEEKALRAIGDAIENGELGGGGDYDVVIRHTHEYNGFYNGERELLKGDYQTLYNKIRNGEHLKCLVYECIISTSGSQSGLISSVEEHPVKSIGIEGNERSGITVSLYMQDVSWFYSIRQDNTLYFGDPD
jgi:hypothetical protein